MARRDAVNFPELLQKYSVVLAITGQMLDAAVNHDWDGLAALESNRDSLVSALQAGSASPPHSETLMKTIQLTLEYNEKIRELTLARMKELSEILNSVGTEKKLLVAYDSPIS